MTTTTTEWPTITAMDLFEQMSDWEGAPPAYLRRYPLADLTEAVVQFTDMATTGHIWISVDLFELQGIAIGAARDYRDCVGEWPA